MIRTLAAITLILVLTLAACDKKDAANKAPAEEAANRLAAEVVTTDFRLPIPVGFKALDRTVVAELERRRNASIDVVLYRERPRTGIAVQRLAREIKDLDSCKPLAEEEALVAKMPVPEVKPFDLGSRTTCRYEFETPDEVASSTVVYANDIPFKVGCSMTKPVKTGRAACDQVARGFSAPPAHK